MTLKNVLYLMTGTSDMNSTPAATATRQIPVLMKAEQCAMAASDEVQAISTVSAEWERGGRPAVRADSRAMLRTLHSTYVRTAVQSNLVNRD